MFLRRPASTLPALLIAALALGPITGCEAPAPIPQPKSQNDLGAAYNTGQPLEPGHARDLGYEPRWVRDVVLAPGQSVTHLFAEDGLVVTFESPTNMITAVDAQDGSILWKSVVGSRLETIVGLTIDRKSVYVNSTSRMFTLARSSGVIKRIVNLEYPVSGSPLRVNRLAVFGSTVGNVYAYHLDHGFTRWAYALKSSVISPPLLSDLQLFAVDHKGHYAMLDADNGDLLWRGQTYGQVSAQPILHDGFVILPSEDQSMYSLVTATGDDRWPVFRSESRLSGSPLASGQQLLIREPGYGLSAVDAGTGERLWFAEQDVQPLHADGRQLIASDGARLVLFDQATGDVQHEAPTQPLLDLKADEAGTIVLLTTGGKLMQITPAP